jgi:crotonobetainyl-CoA:carnitine CoA-transferase CaiB-like acyl-CoA transferase
MQQLFADPHVKHRDLVLQVPHASGVNVPLLRSPLHLSAAPVVHRAPPTLGQHSDQVLHELLGKNESDIARLRAAGVV